MSYTKQNFKDGQILTAEHLNHIEDGLVKCPQVYTDENGQVHKLDNKYLDLDWIPKSNETSEVVFETQEVKLNTNRIKYFTNDNVPIRIFIGRKYVAEWNGVPYTLEGKYFEIGVVDGVGVLGFSCIGNPSIVDASYPNTGEPFVYYYNSNANGEILANELYKPVIEGDANTPSGATVTFGVTQFISTINKIPVELLSEGVPCVLDSKVELLPETQAVDMGDGEFALLDVINGINSGDTYIVTYNGVPYKCVANPFDMDGVTLNAVGNGAIMELPFGNDEPFFMLIVPPELVSVIGAGAQLYALDGASSVTMAISKVEEIVQKIDERCLPDWLLALKPE